MRLSRAAFCAVFLALVLHSNQCTATTGVAGRVRAFAARDVTELPSYMRVKAGNDSSSGTSWLVLDRNATGLFVSSACHFQPWSLVALPLEITAFTAVDVPNQTTGSWEPVISGTLVTEHGNVEDAVVIQKQISALSNDTGLAAPGDDCSTLITGTCPITWGDPLDLNIRCWTHCVSQSHMDHADTQLDKCLDTLDSVMQGSIVQTATQHTCDLQQEGTLRVRCHLDCPGRIGKPRAFEVVDHYMWCGMLAYGPSILVICILIEIQMRIFGRPSKKERTKAEQGASSTGKHIQQLLSSTPQAEDASPVGFSNGLVQQPRQATAVKSGSHPANRHLRLHAAAGSLAQQAQAAGGAIMASETVQQASDPSGAQAATTQADTVHTVQRETEMTQDTQRTVPPEAQMTEVIGPTERAGPEQQRQATDVAKATHVVNAAVPNRDLHQAAAEARPVLREAAYQANIALQEPYMIPKSMHHSGCGPSTVPEQQDVMTNYPAVHDAVCQTSPADEPQVVRLQAASSAEDTCQPAPKAVIEKTKTSKSGPKKSGKRFQPMKFSKETMKNALRRFCCCSCCSAVEQ